MPSGSDTPLKSAQAQILDCGKIESRQERESSEEETSVSNGGVYRDFGDVWGSQPPKQPCDLTFCTLVSSLPYGIGLTCVNNRMLWDVPDFLFIML